MSTEPDITSNPPIDDQERRRIAKRRAALLEEAAVLAEALRAVLQRAGHPDDAATQLIKDLKKSEMSELQASFGVIESRRRHAGSGTHPLIEQRLELDIFLDESGSSHVNRNDPTPFFALCGTAMTEVEVKDYQSRADAIKYNYFGRTDVTFHEPFMRQRRQGFDFGQRIDLQERFDREIENLLANSDFVLFAIGIRKRGFEQEFTATGIDPCIPTDVYVAAIMLFLERAVDFLRDMPQKALGRLVFESQQAAQDLFHQQEYCRICREGTRFVRPHEFQHHLRAHCGFVPKQGSHPTEISDIVSRDIFEWMKDGCKQKPKFWDAYASKFYFRDDGNRGKCGLKVFPASDLLDRLQQARDQIQAAKTK